MSAELLNLESFVARGPHYRQWPKPVGYSLEEAQLNTLDMICTKLDLASGDHLLKAGAASVDIQIPYGSPTALILEQGRCEHYSLILMGTQGRGFLQELFLGSVSHNVRPPRAPAGAVRAGSAVTSPIS